MPQATDEKVVQIEGFEGLNTRDAKNTIGEKELSEAVNFDLGPGGELVKRPGFATTIGFAGVCRILGFYSTDTRQEFVAGYYDSVNNVWNIATSTDPVGVGWTHRGGLPAGATPQHGVQYVDKFYVLSTGGANGITQWDGTAITQITGTPTGTYCRVFKDRLFICHSTGTGVIASRLYYSKIADFSSTGWPATNYIDVGSGDGDRLIGFYNVQDTLSVFKSQASWNLYVQGDPTLWILRPFNNEVGCISKNTFALHEGTLYFCSARGVYQTDGNTMRNISEKIAPAWKNIVVSGTAINQAHAFLWDDRYLLALETFPVLPTWNAWANQTWGSLSGTTWAGSGSVITYLAYHIRAKGWTTWKLALNHNPWYFVPVLISATLRGVYCSSRTAGSCFKFGTVRYQDLTTDYECVVETKEFDFGSPTELKRGKWLGVALRAAGLHTLSHVVDGNTKAPISVTTEQADLEHKVAGPEYFRSWRFRVAATHSNPITIFGFHLHLSRRRHLEKSRG